MIYLAYVGWFLGLVGFNLLSIALLNLWFSQWARENPPRDE